MVKNEHSWNHTKEVLNLRQPELLWFTFFTHSTIYLRWLGQRLLLRATLAHTLPLLTSKTFLRVRT